MEGTVSMVSCTEDEGLIAVLRRSGHAQFAYGLWIQSRKIARSEFHTVSRDLGESSWYAGGVAKRGT